VSASPGFGYRYRWDQDGDGQWDSPTFGDQASVEVKLERNQARTVRLGVKNALGFTAERSFSLVRPKEDAQKPGRGAKRGRGGKPVTLTVEQGRDGQVRAVPPGGGQP
jgi:hypothetical protein